jgi:TPP-dependent pyruvate/acetoin dehydrogenase alpha subunit
MAEAGISREVLEGIDESVHAEVEAAVEFAVNAPYPDPAEVDTNVYA